MALFLRQDEQRSKLQERITAELNEKAKRQAEIDRQPPPDNVEDSRFLRDSQMMSTSAWIGALIILLAITGLVVWALV